RRAFAVLARERLTRFQHRDRGAKAAKGLRELETDGARADDDQMFRPHGEIEHGFVGEVGHRFEPRDRRKRRRGAGRDDEAPRLTPPPPPPWVWRPWRPPAPAPPRGRGRWRPSFKWWGAIAAMRWCWFWCPFQKSLPAPPADTPKARACATARACFAAAISDF